MKNMSDLQGLLLIDKPIGPTSHDIVDRVRRVLGIRAVGHAGTLDPFASGLLIMGIGKGTKALTALVGQDKTYEITAILGKRTDTFDREGRILEEKTPNILPTQEDIERLLPAFRGSLKQKAPLFSAIKQGGKKLYELARAGIATEDQRPVRDVTIHRLERVAYAWPTLTLIAEVSSGTYIRSLVDDIGTALETGAYVTDLRRTRVGTFDVQDAIDGKTLDRETVIQHLLPLD